MRLIFTIAARELKTLFLSPLAWSILGLLQFILAYLFLTQVDAYAMLQPRLAALETAPGITDLVVTPLYGSAAIVLLLIIPLLTMRLVSEERRSKTLPLLISAPVSNHEIILGKYLGVVTLLLIMVLMISVMPLSLLAGGELDCGKLFANILALTLVLASFAAIGLYLSCVASHPTIAAIGSFSALLLLWILDWTSGLHPGYNAILEYLSMLSHFQNLQSGLIASRDLCYFLLFSATFLLLSIHRLDYERLQK